MTRTIYSLCCAAMAFLALSVPASALTTYECGCDPSADPTCPFSDPDDPFKVPKMGAAKFRVFCTNEKTDQGGYPGLKLNGIGKKTTCLPTVTGTNNAGQVFAQKECTN